MSNIEILRRREQPTLFIRTTASVRDLPVLIGGGYGKLAAHLAELGERLSEVPYVAYHNMDMENLDVEMGFPVAKTLPGSAEIKSGSIPAGEIAFCMYRGAYAEMGPVYNEMARWMEENELKPLGISYEYYYNGPEYPESEKLTMIAMPLA
ncbi:MAG: GyrI-like domain-containing protein [Clostridiales bacterium]|nr:GyrI-like domain-containing protein [Clostridiales bacterium]